MPRSKRPFPGVWQQPGRQVFVFQFRYQRCRKCFAGYTDARLTSRLRQDVVRLIERHEAGEAIDPHGLAPRLAEIAVELGIIKSARRRAELSELLEEYCEHLESKDNTADYLKSTITRIRRMIEGCGFRNPADLGSGKVQKQLHECRQRGDFGIKTSNQIVGHLQSFGKWLVREKVLPHNPFVDLEHLNAEAGVRRRRRAITDDEFVRLLEAMIDGTTHHCLSHSDRVTLYLADRDSRFRTAELESLTLESFNLDSSPPTVTVEATISKRRREDVQVLPSWLVPELQKFVAGKPTDEPLWPSRWSRRAGEMLKVDLEAAGIPYRDKRGQQADFHALRHTFTTSLARAGVSPKVVQKLARHSSITLTMNVYTHVEQQGLATAVESMPSAMQSLHTDMHGSAQLCTNGD